MTKDEAYSLAESSWEEGGFMVTIRGLGRDRWEVEYKGEGCKKFDVLKCVSGEGRVEWCGMKKEELRFR